VPLEISEIGIYVRVADAEPADESLPQASADPLAAAERERIVQECVRRVVQALRLAGER
jgi:hypothetical protein